MTKKDKNEVYHFRHLRHHARNRRHGQRPKHLRVRFRQRQLHHSHRRRRRRRPRRHSHRRRHLHHLRPHQRCLRRPSRRNRGQAPPAGVDPPLDGRALVPRTGQRGHVHGSDRRPLRRDAERREHHHQPRPGRHHHRVQHHLQHLGGCGSRGHRGGQRGHSRRGRGSLAHVGHQQHRGLGGCGSRFLDSRGGRDRGGSRRGLVGRRAFYPFCPHERCLRRPPGRNPRFPPPPRKQKRSRRHPHLPRRGGHRPQLGHHQ
mmetsp:Transcript_6549/g.13438  ORF Transcript_6549/g.13438 Transcript_6549/m.13438 type:complete len:258 (-) Transcript_6549:913-1686(-)